MYLYGVSTGVYLVRINVSIYVHGVHSRTHMYIPCTIEYRNVHVNMYMSIHKRK